MCCVCVCVLVGTAHCIHIIIGILFAVLCVAKSDRDHHVYCRRHKHLNRFKSVAFSLLLICNFNGQHEIIQAELIFKPFHRCRLRAFDAFVYYGILTLMTYFIVAFN